MRKWISLFGTFDQTEKKIIFKGGIIDTSQNIKSGLYLLNKDLWEGSISAKVKFKNVDANNTGCSIVINYNPGNKNFLCAGIGGKPKDMYVITEFSPTGWNDIESAGDRSNLKANQEYTFDILIKGTRVILKIDGVKIFDTNISKPFTKQQIGIYCASQGEIEISDFDLVDKNSRVFTIMKFSSPFNEVYQDVIKPICTSSDFKLDVKRADETYGPGLIINDIIRDIELSKIIIADITPVDNANVFFELGYAFAVKKPIILLSEKETLKSGKLPFDISPFRILVYENSIRGKKEFEDGLRNHLKAILENNE
jgi:hypothetical protein